ncbi:hypothetical protein F4804DRAFT_313684 [Jackrogersella minutella]|nr:hypothetical protein F4804DRAFT_313684 [Jackrogersella minutella]
MASSIFPSNGFLLLFFLNTPVSLSELPKQLRWCRADIRPPHIFEDTLDVTRHAGRMLRVCRLHLKVACLDLTSPFWTAVA